MKKFVCAFIGMAMLLCSVAYSDVQPSEWAKKEVSAASAAGISNESVKNAPKENITRDGFCELAYNLWRQRETTAAKTTPFDDTASPYAAALYELEIIKGRGNRIFAPDDFITREEAATILYRIVNRIGSDELRAKANAAGILKYIDHDNISAWALTSVYSMREIGIMQGNEKNEFEPTKGYTAEQAAATLYRILKENNEPSFSDKLYAAMPQEKNYMYSPFSVKSALCLAANGASDETKAEILNTVGVADLDAFNADMKKTIDKYSENNVLSFNIANSIWINKDRTQQSFSNIYKDKAAEFFGATAAVTDNGNAVADINGWVNKKTNGKISKIVNDNSFWAMLVNAVYFKAAWENEFFEGATAKADFTDRNGNVSQIDFMHNTLWTDYCNEQGVKVARLPYKNRADKFTESGEYLDTEYYDDIDISMYVMQGDSLNRPEEILKDARLEHTYVSLIMPKFTINYDVTLNETLKNLGIGRAFNENAQFEGMFDNGNMFISDVIHKTYISVDEKGTEASAVTAIGMAGTSMPPEPVKFVLDKPFTFVIRDDISAEILFIGEYAFAQ